MILSPAYTAVDGLNHFSQGLFLNTLWPTAGLQQLTDLIGIYSSSPENPPSLAQNPISFCPIEAPIVC